MKRSNRALSAALAVVLALSMCGIPAFGAEPAQSGGSHAPDATQTEPEASPDGASAADPTAASDGADLAAPLDALQEQAGGSDPGQDPSEPAGSVLVALREGRGPCSPDGPLPSTLVVGLAGESAACESQTVRLPSAEEPDGSSPATGTVRFEGLADGVYTLSASGDGFASYQQDIEVRGDACSVVLYAGTAPVVEGSAAHPGVVLFGDATRDGIIDGQDAVAVVDAIESSEQPADGTELPFDMNDDGKADLADLQIVAEAMGSLPASSTVARSVAPAAVRSSVEAADGAVEVTQGSLEGLVGGAGEAVQLTALEEISPDKPVSLAFDFAESAASEGGTVEMGGMTIASPQAGEGALAQGQVTVDYLDAAGQQRSSTVDIQTQAATDQPTLLESVFGVQQAYADSAKATVAADGTIVVDFGGRIAVKKVTLKITKTSGSNPKLAAITSVEFLNDMESRIPAPEMNVPTGLAGHPGSKKFSVSWDAQRNVTGYELSVSAGGVQKIVRTASTTASFTTFADQKIKNGTVFAVKVQSVNGDWRSGWSDEITVVPVTDHAPDPPENVKVASGYRSLSVTWKNAEDTDTCDLYYRVRNTGSFSVVEGIEGTSCTVSDLADNTEYELYLVAQNEIGRSGRSQTALGTTANVQPAQLPGYRLINTQASDGTYLTHIASATHGWASPVDTRYAMVDSPLDEASGVECSALGLFDGSFASYWQVNDWDEGGSYYGEDKGVFVTFDEAQTVGMISFAEVTNGGSFGSMGVRYKDENGKWVKVPATVQQRTDANGRKYELVKLGGPVTATSFQLCMSRGPKIVIAEMRFHAYDGLEDDIMALYADDLHLELSEGATEQSIDALQARLDTPDAASGEYHPYRASLQKELDNARSLLAASGLDDVVRVHDGISTQDASLGVGGLNAWQPLGAAAAAGDEIVVYVGGKGMATGSSTSLKLVMTQQHPESAAVARTVCSLKTGRNEITLPETVSMAVERGGQLYVQYDGKKSAGETYGVRVSGASPLPVLDLYRVDDAAERLARTTAYVEELDAHVAGLKQAHEALHDGGANASVQFGYDAANCILNATDIQLDQMMYSVPASQILFGANGGTAAERAERLLDSFDAMDQMMELFYQHKGLVSSADKAINQPPARHLNIRYTRMFSGAFMYASGNHIGIEWGSVTGLSRARTVEYDANGKNLSYGFGFGWGIAHEIGHNINQSQYAFAEVTNNYFAQLARTDETSASTRFRYADVYDRVTSGAMGRAGDVFVQLAMYWQLRLAYDAGDAYTLYGTYDEAFKGRLFARIDSYARNTEAAPAPQGVKLKLGAGEQQNFMRLASAAAERDLTGFFARWGFVPNAETKAYLAQFPAEERAVCYVDDDARAYARSHEDTGLAAGKDVVRAEARADGSQVTLSMSAGALGDSLLGFEVVRVIVSGGQQQREVVGFSTDGTFVDNASILGNRAVSYEAVAVDKFLNRSAACTVAPLKLDGDGLHAKDAWSVSTNMASAQDTAVEPDEEDPDAPAQKPAVVLAVDGDASTVYTGSCADADPSVTIDMGSSAEVTSLRYRLGPSGAGTGAAIGTYRIEAGDDGVSYRTLKEGTFQLDDDGSATLYFDNGKDPWVCTYDARYLRITAVGQAGAQLSVGEFDVYGPSGDNVDFLAAGEGAAIGILKSDFVYQQASATSEQQLIPKGSVVFTGAYKGNPAYNVAVLYDGQGNVVGGTDAEGNLTASQIILAPQPGNALLGETSEGRWVYWIEPGADGSLPQLPAQVRAELYRVDNALTNEGQRLVSDTLLTAVPAELPFVELTGAAGAGPAGN